LFRQIDCGLTGAAANNQCTKPVGKITPSTKAVENQSAEIIQRFEMCTLALGRVISVLQQST
jgi:hypothetical protein